ncbi:hypothetical protein QEH59_17600 [Coraliomargarita sp. SDUM461004]|uniref:Uncharacterized protein n=1 Tax=Thalassobacterium sedimentorum TaxID=3041258 RepID=A0ABU1AN76_9BACT|nr:hypothetical protein [Coraliomargarita sp. SDUM461004]MDQ8196254.1 hypothetical protein [Coraliomargarita sp. SDUM461004]
MRIFNIICAFCVIHSCLSANTHEQELKRATATLVNQLEGYGKTPDSVLQMLRQASLDYDFLMNSNDLDFLYSGLRAYESGDSLVDGVPAHLSWPFSSISDVRIFGVLAYDSRTNLLKQRIDSMEAGVFDYTGIYEALSDLSQPDYYKYYNSKLAALLPDLFALASVDSFDRYLKESGYSEVSSFENSLYSLMMSIYVNKPSAVSGILCPVLVDDSIQIVDRLVTMSVNAQEMDLLIRTQAMLREKISSQVQQMAEGRNSIDTTDSTAKQIKSTNQVFVRGFVQKLFENSDVGCIDCTVEDLVRSYMLYADIIERLDSSSFNKLVTYFIRSYE